MKVLESTGELHLSYDTNPSRFPHSQIHTSFTLKMAPGDPLTPKEGFVLADALEFLELLKVH